MANTDDVETSIDVVRRANVDVQATGNWELYDELYSDDFVNHTGLEGYTNDKAGVLQLYKDLRAAFNWTPYIHFQTSDGEKVTTYKHYHGTHQGEFFGIAATGKPIQLEVIDVMSVRGGQITDHWGIGDFVALMRQMGAIS